GLPCHGHHAAARGLTPAFAGAGSASHAGAAPRTTTWRPWQGNAGYVEAVNRLLVPQGPARQRAVIVLSDHALDQRDPARPPMHGFDLRLRQQLAAVGQRDVRHEAVL